MIEDSESAFEDGSPETKSLLGGNQPTHVSLFNRGLQILSPALHLLRIRLATRLGTYGFGLDLPLSIGCRGHPYPRVYVLGQFLEAFGERE